MPVIKSAIKKLRKDKKREKENDALRDLVDKTLKEAKKKNTSTTVSKAFSVVDKAVKKNLMHKNKAARIKASLSKSQPAAKEASTIKKPTPPKKTVKSPVKKKAPSKK